MSEEEFPIHKGCNMDLCPRGHEYLCCFECEELDDCVETYKKICDEYLDLKKQEKTKFDCEWYHSSNQSITEAE